MTARQESNGFKETPSHVTTKCHGDLNLGSVPLLNSRERAPCMRTFAAQQHSRASAGVGMLAEQSECLVVAVPIWRAVEAVEMAPSLTIT
jgi:hypothetical protein